MTIALGALLAAACSNKQTTPEFEDHLAPNIRSDGSKEFYYTITMANTGQSNRGSGGSNVSGGARVKGGSASNTRAGVGVTVGGSGGKKGGRQSGRRSRGASQSELITKQLEKTLKASGFCQKGWIELERENNRPTTSIRGECNDTATAKDRQSFPSSDDIS